MTPRRGPGVAPAGYFDRFYAGRDWRYYRWILAQVLQRAEPGRILDLGCGSGLLVELAHRWGLDCTGMEASAEGIALARQRLPAGRFVHADVADGLPFGDECFSVVLLNQVIEHLGPSLARSAVSEAHRVLQPGGMLMVFSPCRADRKELAADPTHIGLLVPGELEALVRASGFGRYERLDAPLPMLGRNGAGRLAMRVVWRVAPLDRFSATANCAAFKQPNNIRRNYV